MYLIFWMVLVVALAMGVAVFAAYARDLQQRLDRAAEGAEAREQDLSALLEAMRERQADIVERLQNLETIVTSAAWERWEEEASAGVEKPPVPLPEADPEPEPSPAEQAARLARRMQA